MNDESLNFAPIDLGAHAELCVEFRLDSYVCSFGTTDKFYLDNTSEQAYVDWLRARMQELPGSCVHLWRKAEIIGQLELERSWAGREIGYVNLYYLVPEARGCGVSERLDEYVCGFYANLGLDRARLNVSPSNDRALRHYEKHGWQNRGPDPRHPEILLFEKTFGTACGIGKRLEAAPNLEHSISSRSIARNFYAPIDGSGSATCRDQSKRRVTYRQTTEHGCQTRTRE
jgi:GNAT superfamily N-acetyltransferase